MKKRNKKLWNSWTPCKKCNGRKTYGGIKILGLFRFKKWEHSCKCNDVEEYNVTGSTNPNIQIVYKGKTELDKQKCEEVLKEQQAKKIIYSGVNNKTGKTIYEIDDAGVSVKEQNDDNKKT